MSDAPPAFPPPVARTIDWLQSSFASWYKHNPPPMPDRFTRREFGFMLWPDRPGPPPFLRHRAYGEKGRLLNYLGWKGPHSAYYSTAYYQRPGELKMADKHWLAAELIFDLDADHLVEAEAAKAAGKELPLEEQLRLVKQQFEHLLDEFIFGDFGIDEKDVFLTFSGGRGYHAHVTDTRLMRLDAKGRREIVDYITGKVPAIRGSSKPDLSPFMRRIPWTDVNRSGVLQGAMTTAKRTKSNWKTHGPDAPGWYGRIPRKLIEQLDAHVIGKNQQEARKWLTGLDGIGRTRADRFIQSLNPAKVSAIRRGELELDANGTAMTIIEAAMRDAALPLGKGETDEPVTADVKRLIRLPGSLHGKSGLRVVSLTRDQLDGFDPFLDAVAFPLDPVRIVARNDNEVSLAGETVRVQAGQETEVPMAHAVWLCSRQQATVAGLA